LTVPSSAAARLRAAERRRDVLTWRVAGQSFEAIGARLAPPVSRQRAHQLYLSALAEVTREPAEDALLADLERLDLLWRAALEQALAGSAQWAAVALRVLERRARILGYDAPARAEVHMTVEEVDQLDAEIEQLLATAYGHDDDSSCAG
jgi:hypothetical protein